MKFTYRWNQRPLEGYTIKRGLGAGGFGEVYFALSDGGKEVALKLIRGHTDVELRGIANCINLKHPYLVHLYDLRTDAQSDRWLVMEYIQGEPLSAILQRHPRGLPEAQAREWFLQTAQAVAYLHDHAVIHRDIKPANLFVENGVAKLGDYGLSKSVSSSQLHQSGYVGTILYMAPEIARGQYSKRTDIYACGVMLYEMLTGEVPFHGANAAEVGLKHQVDTADLSKVPASYKDVLEKALQKNPERRYATMIEMIEAVERLGRPTPSVPVNAITQSATSLPPLKPQVAVQPISPVSPTPPSVERPNHGRWNDMATALALAPLPAAATASVWAMFEGSIQWPVMGTIFLLVTLLSWAILIPAKLGNFEKKRRPNALLMGLIGALIGVGGFWMAGWQFPMLPMEDSQPPLGWESSLGGTVWMERGAALMLAGYAAYFALALGILNWWENTDRRRDERFSLYPLFAAGIFGFLMMLFFHIPAGAGEPHLPVYLCLVLGGTAAGIQVICPCKPPAPVITRYRRRLNEQSRPTA
jgi:serine/threonine protein kinase